MFPGLKGPISGPKFVQRFDRPVVYLQSIPKLSSCQAGRKDIKSTLVDPVTVARIVEYQLNDPRLCELFDLKIALDLEACQIKRDLNCLKQKLRSDQLESLMLEQLRLEDQLNNEWIDIKEVIKQAREGLRQSCQE